MAQVTIREAVEGDLPAVLDIYLRSGIDRGGGYTLEEARVEFARFRQYPSYRLFVAEADGVVAGTYTLLIVNNLAKRGLRPAVAEDVAVLPELQGRGIGKAMMEHALAECRAARCYKLALSSNLRREAAHRFYEGLGFARHGYSFAVVLDEPSA